jgi:hypothetical protein
MRRRACSMRSAGTRQETTHVSVADTSLSARMVGCWLAWRWLGPDQLPACLSPNHDAWQHNHCTPLQLQHSRAVTMLEFEKAEPGSSLPASPPLDPGAV